MKELKSRSARFWSNLINFLSGLIIGFTVCSQLTTFRHHWRESHFCSSNNNQLDVSQQFEDKNAILSQLIAEIQKNNADKNLVLIGVMTAQKYLDSRALAIYKSWAQDLKGRVIFFSSSSSRYDLNKATNFNHILKLRSSYGLPLVSLPTVDDSYPPQKKSFLMFKFMSDHFIDKFEFFMRADDDVYVNAERLERFLRSVNSSKPQFIGQAGVGNKEEFGQLSLESNQNFCMGGPGVVMSQTTLRLFSQNIKYCLKHLYSTHEDVEIGRCVRLSVGIPCTWSYEMQNLFHHNSSHESSFKNGLIASKEMSRALTIHPIKSPPNMKRLHLFFKNDEHQKARHELNVLLRTLRTDFNWSQNMIQEYKRFSGLGQPIDFESLTKKYSSISWDFISHNIYSSTNINPKRHVESHIMRSLDTNIRDIMSSINSRSKQKGRIMEFKNLYYGYIRLNPLVGTEFILDLLLVYKRLKGRKLTLPVRRHTYAVQTFSQSKIREVMGSEWSRVVNIVVPLSGRVEAFKRFVDNFKQVLTEDKYLSLAVVLFPDTQSVENLSQVNAILNRMQDSGLAVKVAQMGGFFSRAAALQRGSAMFDPNDLLLFLDVDMQFSAQVIGRVRLNTIHRKQMYFPIVFSQYSPQFVPKESNQDLSETSGYWRQFGFGIVSLFNSDLQLIGGFNVSIHGWGMEDVNLYDRVIRSNLTIFRAIDPDLVHIYHDIHCNPSLSRVQYEMCLGTKLTSLGSVSQLALRLKTGSVVTPDLL